MVFWSAYIIGDVARIIGIQKLGCLSICKAIDLASLASQRCLALLYRPCIFMRNGFGGGHGKERINMNEVCKRIKRLTYEAECTLNRSVCLSCSVTLNIRMYGVQGIKKRAETNTRRHLYDK